MRGSLLRALSVHALLFGITVPAVLILINRTLTPILEIRTHARNILDNVVTLTGNPDMTTDTAEAVARVLERQPHEADESRDERDGRSESRRWR